MDKKNIKFAQMNIDTTHLKIFSDIFGYSH